ncbi:MAG: hypothetical protein LW630_02460 [Saprospiraceae bacterium]|jgi:hypothetical protein|nr:hypothetical protein [Saprospiraceae bacterium]
MRERGNLLLFLIFCAISVYGQKQDTTLNSVYAEEDLYEDDPYFWSNTKEVGLNITPLLSRFVPFNFGDRPPGMQGFQWKRYYSKRAFRLGLGANIGESTADSQNFFLLSVGLEKRYPISRDKKWTYSSSWDAMIQAAVEESFLAGISKGYGLEFHLNRRIFLGTQAQLILGIDNDGPRIMFQMPADVFLHVRIY